LKYLLIADRSITIQFEDSDEEEEQEQAVQESDDEDEESKDETSRDEDSREDTLIRSTVSQSQSSESPDAFSAINSESMAVKSEYSRKKTIGIREGKIKITQMNFKIVFKILTTLKHKDVPVKVLEFANKIVQNLDGIDFETISSSHHEKLQHLFYYQLFKSLSYVFKNGFEESSEIGSVSTSRSHTKMTQQIISNLESFVQSEVSGRIKNVLNEPSANQGSVGFIAGLSTVLKYLSKSTVDVVLANIHRPIIDQSENFVEILPLIICFLQNFEKKFSDKEVGIIKKLCLSGTKKGGKRSKKLYLSLQ